MFIYLLSVYLYNIEGRRQKPEIFYTEDRSFYEHIPEF